MLRWSAEDLAQRSAVGVATIRRAEVSEDKTSLTIPNDSAIRTSLEVAGVEFIDENGGGPGVRLRKRQRLRSQNNPEGAGRIVCVSIKLSL